MIALVLALHTMAAVVWVGGMFFTLMVLRPSVGVLPVEQRLALWRVVLERFFFWVWLSVAVLLASGYGVVAVNFEDLASLAPHIQIMQVTGLIMVVLFVGLWTRPWQTFRHALQKGDLAAAGKALSQIRLIVTINLGLGLLTAAVGATGAYWVY